jgi:hypothetical protein
MPDLTTRPLSHHRFLSPDYSIIQFALRKWRLRSYAPWALVYALSLAAAVSLIPWAGGKPWTLWLGGFLYLFWAVYGYTVEYIKRIEWRSPMRWPVGGPYLLLYLATVMFYWWPLALIYKPLWYAYGGLFVISTVLNVSSHKK